MSASPALSLEQFVLDKPTIMSVIAIIYLNDFTAHSVLQLNVTASPILPSGLTYKCSFSESEGVFPVEVEAVEVVAGTEYQCDIRGAVMDLGTVLAGME